MMLVMVGRRANLHCLRRVVGIGSSSHDVSGEPDMSVDTSSIVAGWKIDISGGGDGGGECGEPLVVEEMKLWSL